MRDRLRRAVAEALQDCFGLAADELPDFSVEPPKQEAHGDLAVNAAMMLARQLRRPPREIAQTIADAVAGMDLVERVEVAGPGFINVFIAAAAWQALLPRILSAGVDYGRSPAAAGPAVMVEFVSANPTGPLHVGHGRGAVVGDVLAGLLEFAGHRVRREFYVNDAGRQVRNLALSLVWWLRRDAGQETDFPEDGYRGDYVAALARSAPAELAAFAPAAPNEEQLRALEDWAVAAMLDTIRADLEAFGVRMDGFASERELLRSGRVEQMLALLAEHGAVEQREGARWFSAEDYGDEKPRVLIKSNGDLTYFATDVAYHLDKIERGYGRLINVWGADHHGYVPRMKAALQALGQPPEALDVVLVQMVSLVREGQPVVLSKRAGAITTLRQVYEEVGCDAARFFFLLRGTDSQMEFDLELAKRHSLDNPVFYVQYGHARLTRLLERAAERGIAVPEAGQAAAIDLAPLDRAEELRLIKSMADFAAVVRRAAASRSPHQLVYYLQELVAGFHSYYTATKKDDPILKGDPPRVQARLILVLALRQVLRNALGLLGVSAPDRLELPAAQEDETP